MRAFVLHALRSVGGSAMRAANLSGRSSCHTKTLSMHDNNNNNNNNNNDDETDNNAFQLMMS